MNRRLNLFYLLFIALAPVTWAQPAINSVAGSNSALPLRNLQIEVRQLGGEDHSRARLSASGQVRLQPGQSGLSADIRAQDQQRSAQIRSLQQALVLNGRSVQIALGNTTPLRLVQVFIVNGVMQARPGTVLLQSGAGFQARPLWDGGNMVELELSAAQSPRAGMAQGAALDTSVAAPLDEWVTVAYSVQDSRTGQSELAGRSNTSGQGSYEIQVRVSLR